MVYLPQEIIAKKRDRKALSEAEIDFLVGNIRADGQGLSEGQIAAFAMAVYLNGMSRAECISLTRAMMRSGIVLNWRDLDLPGPVLDKHSSGGVGDKVSLMLAPIVAACGGFVPMISGRGLGHTGGTLDKLNSIPGYNAAPDRALFRSTVRDIGCAIIGQTADLAPADGRLYAIRDVTATVESIPLITASILSKKLAAGLEGLAMDVKTGSGAFAASFQMAEDLAESIVAVANGAGLRTTALITDMNQVLGFSAGNALEVMETIAYLTDAKAREPRLHKIVLALAAEMLLLGGLVPSVADGEEKAQAALDSGRAAAIFARMVAALGGPKDLLEKPALHLKAAPVVKPCPALRAGNIAAMNTRGIGLAIIGLGGGRKHPADGIDAAPGFTSFRALGDKLEAGEPICLVHAASEATADAAIAEIQAAVSITEAAPAHLPPLIHKRLASEGGEAA